MSFQNENVSIPNAHECCHLNGAEDAAGDLEAGHARGHEAAAGQRGEAAPRHQQPPHVGRRDLGQNENMSISYSIVDE